MKENWSDRLYRLKNYLNGNEAYYRYDLRHTGVITRGNRGTQWTFIPGLLPEGAIVYAFGAGLDIAFEQALHDEFNFKVFLFDPTPMSAAYVRSLHLPRTLVFEETGLAAYDGSASFYLPDNPDYVSATIAPRHDGQNFVNVRVERLKTIMKRYGHDHIDLLKMDIEGAEYDVVNDIIESGIEINQLLIEFHHRFAEIGIEKTKKALQQLRNSGFRLFHVSAIGEELSLLRESEK